MDLYRVASILCQEDLIELRSLFAMITPTQAAIVDEAKALADFARKRAAKAEVISTGAVATDASLSAAASAMDRRDDSAMLGGGFGAEPASSAQLANVVSFAAAAASQEAEDRRLVAASELAYGLDDGELLARNQKLGLVCALMEHGAWPLAKQLLDRIPEGYALGVS